MNRSLPELSPEQWDFLAVLETFGLPVSIDLAGYLVPLPPGPLFDLLEKAEPLGWIKKVENNRFTIGDPLPKEVRVHLRNINTRNRLEEMAGKITLANGLNKVGLREKLAVFDKANWVKEAGACEMDLARSALKENRPDEALMYLESALHRFMECSAEREEGELFIAAILEYSNLCCSLGRGYTDLERFLQKALGTAKRMGDRRAQVVLNLHLGRLYYFTDQQKEALEAFTKGFEGTKELDDDDIREQSAEFLGMFFFIKGLFREAMEQFEHMEKVLKSNPERSFNPFSKLLLGYCAAFLGQFHQAIGYLDHNWRQAMEQSDPALASTFRSFLGCILVLLRKEREGLYHLQHAQREAERTSNALGLYLAGAGLALYDLQRGQVQKAYEISKKTIQQGMAAGLIRFFAAPWILEMIYEFHLLGFETIFDLEFSALIKRLLSGVNIHLKGVAWRIQAHEFMRKGGNQSQVIRNLSLSEECLEQAGDPVQLSKTVLERAKFELGQGRRESARGLVQKAKGLLGGYGEEFFPDEFRNLLEQETSPALQNGHDQFLEGYLEMVESLYPSETQFEIFERLLTSTSRIFGAERSGFFEFPSGKFNSTPELKVTHNLALGNVRSEHFKTSLRLIKKTFQSRQPQVGRFMPHESTDSLKPLRSFICIPVEMEDKVMGVLYYDNSYLDDAFDFLEPALLKQMVHHTNVIIERRFKYLQKKEQSQPLPSENLQFLLQGKGDMIHHSRVMKELLKKANHLAGTESTILILGETGTGKELLARSIHDHSPRQAFPFVVVDVTTIPENLLESELFGYERGAFTGADNRKIGRLELAHQGTLFLDEIGELSLAAQAKLLRVLQDKTFTRLGGTKNIISDFRLIAATNRKLDEEVAAGRFRQDLFYRLNVIPLVLPPLRERQEDITVLAEYFLKYYAAKYTRPISAISAREKERLLEYRWPGNIRELKNVIERAVLLSDENHLELNLPVDSRINPANFEDLPSMDEFQRRYIEFVIQKTGGKISGPGGVAEILGMKRTTLYHRMKLLGVRA